MAKKKGLRNSMKTCLKILQLKFNHHRTNRDIALAVGLSASTIHDVLLRFSASGNSWPLSEGSCIDELEKILFPVRKLAGTLFIQPDWLHVDTEMRRPGVTRQLLWIEYKESAGKQAMSYSQFCRVLKDWRKKQRRSMRQVHKAGEKLFIDFCGPTVPVIDPDTGEIRRVAIFVAVMGASNYTYVEACEGQDMMSWLNANSRCLTFLGGVPELLIPDNLRSAVKKADRYEPEINASYQALAEHFGTVILPARPRKPKDKPKAENGVLIVERWLLARIRNETFYTLRSLNQRLHELLNDLNNRPMKGYCGQTRAERFAMLDAPALSALPLMPYEYTEYRTVKVAPDYHVEYRHHWYSVPHELVGERLELKASQTLIQVWHKGKCVAQHPSSQKPYSHTTHPAHMPASHRAHKGWTPERLLNNARRTGPYTREVVAAMLKSKPHPEQTYRAVLGLLSLQRKYGAERLEMACRKACQLEKPERRFIENLLRYKREAPDNEDNQITLPLEHENLRGPGYYH